MKKILSGLAIGVLISASPVGNSVIVSTICTLLAGVR